MSNNKGKDRNVMPSEYDDEFDDEELDPRFEFCKKVVMCYDLIKVSDASHIFLETLKKISTDNSYCRSIKEKVGEEEWTKFEMSLVLSFYSALYVNCEVPNSVKHQRIKEIMNAFKDAADLEIDDK